MAAAAATSDDDVQMMQKIHHSVLIVHRQTPVFDISETSCGLGIEIPCLLHIQWRRHTRCVGCVRTPCEENTFLQMISQ